jgi:hypothetical protein
MPKLDRRNFLSVISAAAAGATTAIPALAAVKAPVNDAGAAPDPMLAAIDEDRRCFRRWCRVQSKLSDAEFEKMKLGKGRPYQTIMWQGRSACLTTMDDRRKKLLQEGRLSPAQIESEYQDGCEQLRAARRAERRWHKDNGLAELKAEYDRATEAWRKSKSDLAKIAPTTPAGAGALVDYVRRDMEGGSASWQGKALTNAIKALSAMPAAA